MVGVCEAGRGGALAQAERTAAANSAASARMGLGMRPPLRRNGDGLTNEKPRKSPSGALVLDVAAALGFGEGLDDRAGVLALFGRIAIDELDHRQRGVVAVTEASLQDADVA